MARRRIPRPVKIDPPGARTPFVDPKTGILSPHGLKMLSFTRDRIGGDVDIIDDLLGLTAISQISSLTAAAGEERTRRELGDALQQIQAQGVERLRSLLEDIRKTTDVQFSQLLGSLARPPQTRVIAFTASDTWRLNPDVRAIHVIAVGGGGGGAGGEAVATVAATPATATGGGGGGGGGLSFAYFEVSRLPASVSITVGAAGTGGIGGGGGGGIDPPGAGVSGGTSSFGSYLVAKGGTGGAVFGVGGAGAAAPGVLFAGGAGADDGVGAANLSQGAPGGGGGGTATWDGATVSSSAGGAGGAGSWRTTSATGGGGAGGAAGASGAAGSTAADSDVYLSPGYGGGGGGSSTAAAGGNGGAGAAGVIGGGGGGGGGGILPNLGGAGGAGGAGRLWVVEYY